MVSIGDVVRYKTPINPCGSFAQVVEIGLVKDSKDAERIGKIYYELTYLDNTAGIIVLEEDLMEVYARQ